MSIRDVLTVSRYTGIIHFVTDETLDLKELCRRTDVTPRTVHYYIQQGVLPPAGSRGPGARYGLDHLNRLRLARRLQREHLPLAEIRQRLEAMTGEDVATALAESEGGTPPAPGESALDYVRGLLAGPSSRSGPPAGSVARSVRLSGANRLAEPAGAPVWSGDRFQSRPPGPSAELSAASLASPATPVPPVSERSQWDRIALAPDVELHVRRPLTRDMNRRLEKLLDAAHDILKED